MGSIGYYQLSDQQPVNGESTNNKDFPARATPPSAAEKAGAEFIRRPAVLKPFHTLAVHVQRLAPETVPANEQDALRQTVDELISELTVLRRKLEAAQ